MIKYIIPKGYKIARTGKRKPAKDLKKEDFDGLFYNGDRKEFVRYFVVSESEVLWIIERFVIGNDVVEGVLLKRWPELWPAQHITKLEKIKKVTSK
jgi:hypothetical protein